MAIISDTRPMPRVLFSALLFFAIPFWIFLVAPCLKRLPTDFRYEADIFSIDHFFDNREGAVSRPPNLQNMGYLRSRKKSKNGR